MSLILVMMNTFKALKNCCQLVHQEKCMNLIASALLNKLIKFIRLISRYLTSRNLMVLDRLLDMAKLSRSAIFWNWKFFFQKFCCVALDEFNSSIYSTNIKQFTKISFFIVKYKIRFGTSKKQINACGWRPIYNQIHVTTLRINKKIL